MSRRKKEEGRGKRREVFFLLPPQVGNQYNHPASPSSFVFLKKGSFSLSSHSEWNGYRGELIDLTFLDLTGLSRIIGEAEIDGADLSRGLGIQDGDVAGFFGGWVGPDV